MTLAIRFPLSSRPIISGALFVKVTKAATAATAAASMALAVVCLAAPAAAAAPPPGAVGGSEAGLEAGAERLVVEGLEAPVRLLRDVEGIPHVFATNEHDLYFVQGWIHAEDRLFQMDVSRRQAHGTLAELFGPAALADDVLLRVIGLGRAAEASVGVVSPEARAALEAYADGVNAWVATHGLPIEYGALELTGFAPWRPADSLAIAKLIAFGLSFDLDDLDRTEALLTYVLAGAELGFDGAALFFEDLFRAAPFDPAATVPDATGASPAIGTVGSSGLSTLSLEALARRAAARIDPVALELIRDFRSRAEAVAPVARAFRTDERVTGSNEWAVAPRHTREGKPLLANDPHLALDSPATFYPIHLRAPAAGVNVQGSGFAGVPYVILGQNQFITWGATTNPLDVTDIFLEEVVVDPASPSGLSTVYEGAAEPIVPVPVTFRANRPGDGVPDNLVVVPPGDGIPPAVLLVPRRNFGPIVELDVEAGAALSVQYTGFSPTREIDAFRLWNRARNLDEFVAGLQSFDVGSQNWAYADVYGNIAYFTSAEMPLREDLQAGFVAGLPPYFLRDGTGGNEWLPVESPQPGQAIPYEILPFDEMPQVVNPPTGWFVNANNDPAGTTLDNDPLDQLRPGGGLYYLSPGYASGFRAGRITDRLTAAIAAGPVDVATMQSIQADVALLDAEVLVPYIVDAFERAAAPGAPPALAAFAADPRIIEAVARLDGWDFTTPTGIIEGFDASDVRGIRLSPTTEEVAASVAATIYSTWRGRMIANSIDVPLDVIGLPRPGSQQAMTALRALFERGGLSASGIDFFVFPGVADPAASRDAVILASLADALDRLAGPEFADAFGGSTEQGDYRWGRLHRVTLDHPLGPPFSVPPAFGAFPDPLGPELPGIPTDGGFGVVDASSHSARADAEDEFEFGSGPVRRYVGQPGFGRLSIEGWSALPGGASGDPTSPFYLNLLPPWLTNEAYPVRQTFDALAGAVVERRVLVPGD